MRRTAGCAVVLLVLCAASAGLLVSRVAVEEVVFESSGVSLSGSIYRPRWGDLDRSIVLVPGSGHVTRRSMAPFAWLFAATGTTALAYDKRGTGASGGTALDVDEFRFDDMAADAAAAFRFLRASRDGAVGYFGASQGSWVVAVAADGPTDPDFLVMVSASVSTVAEDRLFGREAEVLYLGHGPDAAAEAVELLQAEHDASRTGIVGPRLLELHDAYRSRPWYGDVGAEPPLPAEHRWSRWQRTVLDFDPLPHLRSIDVPVLWLFGDPALDRFAPVALSVERLRGLEAAGKDYTVRSYPGADHGLEWRGTGGAASTWRTWWTIRRPLIRDLLRWLGSLPWGLDEKLAWHSAQGSALSVLVDAEEGDAVPSSTRLGEDRGRKPLRPLGFARRGPICATSDARR